MIKWITCYRVVGDKAFKEAQKYSKPKVIWSGKSEKYTKIPAFDALEQTPDAKYLHICANETIHGVEFKTYPTPKNGLLIADMSSNFCSKPVTFLNSGSSTPGHRRMWGHLGDHCDHQEGSDWKCSGSPPVMLDYKIHDDNNSLYNTPPCYGIYMCGLVLRIC
ncbi:putative phosphoserine transaminase [Rosa chinensis]|uniref:Putative phosphoserine transaminase n=1 Tax=Rosa chinensis TaxID=74649 RepID=A0A2P6RLC4_ROSCH|nr:putative phosphoserine transaminase [Rosa chinensis]